jgi:hypothetical protein
LILVWIHGFKGKAPDFCPGLCFFLLFYSSGSGGVVTPVLSSWC